jgi:hypothetical protein
MRFTPQSPASPAETTSLCKEAFSIPSPATQERQTVISLTDDVCYVLVQAYALKERCCDLTSASPLTSMLSLPQVKLMG